MKKFILFIFLCLFINSFGYQTSSALDRITLKEGDIFLGTIVEEIDSRYHIDRYGYYTIIPTWFVKRIEKEQSTLPMSAEAVSVTPYIKKETSLVPSVVLFNRSQQVVPPTPTPVVHPLLKTKPDPLQIREFELMGKKFPVLSFAPAEPSHLEMYPKRSHFYVPSKRYLRGYLVNLTEKGYQSLLVEITYYTKIPGTSEESETHTNFRQTTEIFKVYPMTMKPFIVDTQFVKWEKIKQIRFQVIGCKPLKQT
jgi:hypothetical protein